MWLLSVPYVARLLGVTNEFSKRAFAITGPLVWNSRDKPCLFLKVLLTAINMNRHTSQPRLCSCTQYLMMDDTSGFLIKLTSWKFADPRRKKGARNDWGLNQVPSGLLYDVLTITSTGHSLFVSYFCSVLISKNKKIISRLYWPTPCEWYFKKKRFHNHSKTSQLKR